MDKPARIVSLSEWITAKDAEGLKIAHRGCGFHRVPEPVHSWCIGSRVLVVCSQKKPEQTLPCLCRKHIAHKGLLQDVSLFVDQHEEKGLVLDNRTVDSSTKLSPVFPVLRNAIEVIKPVARVESRVSIVPEKAASELVGSGPCHHLNLPGAAAWLGVHRSRDDTNLLDEIGADKID